MDKYIPDTVKKIPPSLSVLFTRATPLPESERPSHMRMSHDILNAYTPKE